MSVISCQCGSVRFEAAGPPMLSAVCHCTSCRTAGRALDAVSGQAPIVDESGGTPAILWRKDRVRCVAGCELLEPHRLKPDSPTRRLVATCCRTPMLLDFTKGFWVTVYRDRVDDPPAPTMRVMTGDAPADVVLPDDGLPRLRSHSGRFMFKLLTSWAAMGFRSPKVAGLPDS